MISVTADYALRAMLVLAQADRGRAMRADEIAAATGAPRNYMGKVLNLVAKSGLVRSTRGPTGGFVLAEAPAGITLGRIVDLFDDIPANPRCMLGNGPCNPASPCRAHEAWRSVIEARRSPFMNTTIADLLEGRAASIVLPMAQESRNVA